MEYPAGRKKDVSVYVFCFISDSKEENAMMNKRVKMGGACILALALTLAGLKLPSAYAALPVDLSQKGSQIRLEYS